MLNVCLCITASIAIALCVVTVFLNISQSVSHAVDIQHLLSNSMVLILRECRNSRAGDTPMPTNPENNLGNTYDKLTHDLND